MEARDFWRDFALGSVTGFLVETRGLVLPRPLRDGCVGDFSLVEVEMAAFSGRRHASYVDFSIGDGGVSFISFFVMVRPSAKSSSDLLAGGIFASTFTRRFWGRCFMGGGGGGRNFL